MITPLSHPGGRDTLEIGKYPCTSRSVSHHARRRFFFSDTAFRLYIAITTADKFPSALVMGITTASRHGIALWGMLHADLELQTPTTKNPELKFGDLASQK
jgi:hypothetical protein